MDKLNIAIADDNAKDVYKRQLYGCVCDRYAKNGGEAGESCGNHGSNAGRNRTETV